MILQWNVTQWEYEEAQDCLKITSLTKGDKIIITCFISQIAADLYQTVVYMLDCMYDYPFIPTLEQLPHKARVDDTKKHNDGYKKIICNYSNEILPKKEMYLMMV